MLNITSKEKSVRTTFTSSQSTLQIDHTIINSLEIFLDRILIDQDFHCYFRTRHACSGSVVIVMECISINAADKFSCASNFY